MEIGHHKITINTYNNDDDDDDNYTRKATKKYVFLSIYV